MAVRVYICPVVGTGAKGDSWRSKAQDYGYQVQSYIPSADGSPAPLRTWALTIVVGDDFTAIDADPACDDLFAGDLPAGIDTRDELRTFLRTRTISDVPLARRNAIVAVLDKYGVDRTDFVGSTRLWRVLQRVVSTLFRSTGNEPDDDFPRF